MTQETTKKSCFGLVKKSLGTLVSVVAVVLLFLHSFLLSFKMVITPGIVSVWYCFFILLLWRCLYSVVSFILWLLKTFNRRYSEEQTQVYLDELNKSLAQMQPFLSKIEMEQLPVTLATSPRVPPGKTDSFVSVITWQNSHNNANASSSDPPTTCFASLLSSSDIKQHLAELAKHTIPEGVAQIILSYTYERSFGSLQQMIEIPLKSPLLMERLGSTIPRSASYVNFRHLNYQGKQRFFWTRCLIYEKGVFLLAVTDEQRKNKQPLKNLLSKHEIPATWLPDDLCQDAHRMN